MLQCHERIQQQISAEAESAYPHECCGFLFGHFHGEIREVTEILPTRNTSDASEQYHRFVITPEQMMQAEIYARQNKLDILGFYHSHPNAEAIPSEYDRSHALPVYSYVIASVMQGHTKEIRSWLLEPDDYRIFIEEMIER